MTTAVQAQQPLVVFEGARAARPAELRLHQAPGYPDVVIDLPAQPMPRGVPDLAKEALAGRETRALSGARLIFMGEKIRLSGINCPPVNAADGRAAKALLNTFLRRAGIFRCVVHPEQDTWAGSCSVRDAPGLPAIDIAAGLVASGLCARDR